MPQPPSPWLSWDDDLPAAVLFDRDGTLIEDVPYNGDPALVRPVSGARAALGLLRARGVPLGVVSNQSGVARGLLTGADVRAVRRRVEELLGPFAVWAVCPHGDDDGCRCRKPAPGLVEAACAQLGADPARTVVIGDIGADMAAARAAGARGILVPTAVTRPAETAEATETAPDLRSAAEQALAPPGRDPARASAGQERSGVRPAAADRRRTATRPSSGTAPRPAGATGDDPEATATPTPGPGTTEPSTPRPGTGRTPDPEAAGTPTPDAEADADRTTDPADGTATAGRGDRPRTLVVRLDSAGDVLLTGPAIRAVAASSARTAVLCGPQGEAAARLLPGLGGPDDVLVYDAPWVGFSPPEPSRADVAALLDRLAAERFDRALVLASARQSPLPTALLLKLAGVPWVGADSEHYPGSLLDLRHQRGPHRHEAEAALDLARAAGFALPAGDGGELRVTGVPDMSALTGPGRYVVLHPGAAVPARAWSAERAARAVDALAAAGHRVVVTGGPGDAALTTVVAGRYASDLGGRTDLAELAGVLAGADAVVVGNTGPAHLAAAVGTPVVSLFAPVVPAGRWLPYRVPTVRLGRADAPCAGTRARVCPVPGHPCLDGVTDDAVLDAVRRLTTDAASPPASPPAAPAGGPAGGPSGTEAVDPRVSAASGPPSRPGAVSDGPARGGDAPRGGVGPGGDGAPRGGSTPRGGGGPSAARSPAGPSRGETGTVVDTAAGPPSTPRPAGAAPPADRPATHRRAVP